MSWESLIKCGNCGKSFHIKWHWLEEARKASLTEDNPPRHRYAYCPDCWQMHVQEVPGNPVVLPSAVDGDGE